MAEVQERRERRLAFAVLLLVVSLLAFGGAGIMIVKNRSRQAMVLGGTGILLLIGAIIVFSTRPGLDDIEEVQAEGGIAPADAAAAAFAGNNTCELVPERSRVTVSSTDPVPLEWSATGCVNDRTQYARNGDVWTRVLVPDGEQAVSVLEFRPTSGEYVVTRYLLDGAAMTRALPLAGGAPMTRVRALRRDVDVKSCTADQEARTVLADQQREINALLPQLPNERLVYRCRSAAGQTATPAAAIGGNVEQ